MPAFSVFLAQVTNAATAAPVNPVDAAAQQRPLWVVFLMYGLLAAMVYYAFFRPTMQANKKKEETVKGARTGDKVVTSGGIHGVITNVKDATVIVRVADNVKLEIEKSHIDRINRPEDSEKVAAAKS